MTALTAHDPEQPQSRNLNWSGTRASTNARNQILTAALDGALSALGKAKKARAGLALGSEEKMTFVAAVGTDGEDLEGQEMDVRRLETEVQAGLKDGRSMSIELRNDDPVVPARRQSFLGRKNRTVFLVPLIMLGELRGVLMVENSGSIGNGSAEGLETVAALAAPALEAVRINEDLHLHQSQERFRSIVQNSSDLVTLIDPDATICYQTPSVESVLGYAPAELVGVKLTELLHPDDATRAIAFFTEAMRQPGITSTIEWRMQHRDGSWLHIETVGNNLIDDPNVGQMVLNSRDITERKTLEEQLAHQAFHDPLTDLANRALLKDRVERALRERKRSEQPFAILFCDLDNFKNVNDSLGHQVGDELLIGVAERLRACVRPADTVSRLGGDEFAILLEDATSVSNAVVVADRIIESLQEPFTLQGKHAFIDTSIGIAMSDPREGADELLRNADIAMYMAKGGGRGRYAIFESSMHADALKRLELESDMRRALEHDELEVHYQPIVELKSGRIEAVEALLRWRHPKLGLLPPSEFIGLAEESGMINAMGRWVLEEATCQVREWQLQNEDDEPLQLSVNISGRQLDEPTLITDVETAIKKSGLDAKTLILEITESVMMHDTDATVDRLLELKALGLKLSVDDFGTGYSSLRYLHLFPIDILKIAKGFIDGLWGDSQEAAFVRTIIELCRTLDVETIAEGVESAEQAYELRKLGSELGQGDYLAKPLTEEEMTVLLRHGRELSRYAREVRSTRERREADWWKRALGGEASAAPAA